MKIERIKILPTNEIKRILDKKEVRQNKLELLIYPVQRDIELLVKELKLRGESLH